MIEVQTFVTLLVSMFTLVGGGYGAMFLLLRQKDERIAAQPRPPKWAWYG